MKHRIKQITILIIISVLYYALFNPIMPDFDIRFEFNVLIDVILFIINVGAIGILFAILIGLKKNNK